MVLTLKRWKSRTPPGIAAGVGQGYPFAKSKGCPSPGSPFAVSKQDANIGDAGWSSPVARQAHNLKVVGSNPTPATKIHHMAASGGLFLARNPGTARGRGG